ncbi:MAG: hypothetical protein Kow0069_15280 [Promethearchaeota archaeon]
MPIDIDELLEVLPKLIRENDRVKGAIISALSGVVATHDDILALQAEMDRRFEAMDRRFEALQAEMDRRFEAMERRFEALQAEMDRRFEAMERRFEALQAEVREGFGVLSGKLDSLLLAFGRPFEQFGRNVVARILEAEGFRGVKFARKVYPNPNRVEFPHAEVEVDGVSEDPPVVVEVTSILRNEKKVDKFLAKKRFLERVTERKFRGFLVAASTDMDQEEKARVVVRLRQANCELINL